MSDDDESQCKEEVSGEKCGIGTELTQVAEPTSSAASEGPTTPRSRHPSQQTSGSFMAGSLVLSNSILGEVLNEKKLALMQSPEVVRFLREKEQTKH